MASAPGPKPVFDGFELFEHRGAPLGQRLEIPVVGVGRHASSAFNEALMSPTASTPRYISAIDIGGFDIEAHQLRPSSASSIRN